MGERERGYWIDPDTSEATPAPGAPYGWVVEPIDPSIPRVGSGWGQVGVWGKIRPATAEEVEG